MDKQELGDLLAGHLPGLVAYLRLQAGPLVRARESCADLAQSVCRELLQDASQLENLGDAAFKGLLYQAALHKILNRQRFWRAKKREAERDIAPLGDEELDLPELYASICTPSQYAQAGELQRAIEDSIDALPDQYREAVLLHRVAGLPHSEIAVRMGKSEGAVRNLVHRGLARLTLLLHERGIAVATERARDA